MASSKYKSCTPKQCIAKGNQNSTSTKTNRLEKKTPNTKNMAYRNAPHFVPRVSVTQLQDRIEREIKTDKWEKSDSGSYLRNQAKKKRTYRSRNIDWKSCLSVHDPNNNSFVSLKMLGMVNSLLK